MSKTKLWQLFSVLVLVSFLVTTKIAAKPAALISDGKANGKIVIPAEPSEAELFIAEELQIYMKKMTGVKVPVVTTNSESDDVAIFIGSHPANERIAKELLKQYPLTGDWHQTVKNHDAIAVVCNGKQLHLTGNNNSAIYWAACDFLESFGVRWLFPGRSGEYVPTIDRIELKPIEKYQAPSLGFRPVAGFIPSKNWDQSHDEKVYEHGKSKRWLHTMRSRGNHRSGFEKKDSYYQFGLGHSYAHYLPEEKYFDRHPEWYAMIDGKRCNTRRKWQVCFTNKQAARQYALNVISELDKYIDKTVPTERVRVCISPNDGKAFCECNNCQKFVDSGDSSTSLIVHFGNMVATEVYKVYPGIKFTFYAYANHIKPPEKAKTGPGICPDLCFWGTLKANHAHPMFSDKNQLYRQYFHQWADVSDGISARTYYGHYGIFTPWPVLTQMATDIPIMAAHPKFYGMYSENHMHWGTQGITFYLQNQLMWDANLDAKEVLEDYYTKGFGPAASHMKAYYQRLQDQMDSVKEISGEFGHVTKILTQPVVEACNKHIDKTESLMDKMDENTRWRTNLVVKSWRASAKTAKALWLYQSPKPNLEDIKVIVGLLKEVREYAATDLGQFAFENDIVERQVGSKIMDMFALPLDALPAGEHTYSDGLSRGGTLKFLAKINGFTIGTYGWCLPGNTKGEINMPFRAEKGNKITAGSVKLAIPKKVSNLDLTISLIGANGSKHTFVDGLKQARTTVAMPGEALGRQNVDLLIEANNKEAKLQLLLDSIAVKITVEVADVIASK